MDGIFVDETPTQYSLEAITCLDTIAEAVHKSDGLKEGYIGRVTFHLGIGCLQAPWQLGLHILAAGRLSMYWLYVTGSHFCNQPTVLFLDSVRRQLYACKADKTS